jgi:hypothetical protein
MSPRLVALSWFAGCYQEVVESVCEDSPHAVADDEVTPDGTAADLLASVTGTGVADGLVLEETPVSVAWTVERGEGSAHWVESVLTEHTTHKIGVRGTEVVWSDTPECRDRLEAPVVASLRTDDGTVDVGVSTTVTPAPEDVGVSTPVVSGDTPYTDAAFPAVPEGEPTDGDDARAFLKLAGFDDVVSGYAGWASQTERSAAVYVLEFPVLEE